MAIRQHFSDKLASKMVEGEQRISIFLISDMKNSWRQRDMARSMKKTTKNKFLEFTLLKMNKDTISALNCISSRIQLGIMFKHIFFIIYRETSFLIIIHALL